MKDRDTYLIQVGLRSLGFDPGPLDGDLGPKTQSARDRWEASLVAADDAGIAARIVALAKADLWIRETEGKNRGPGIAKYWEATSYPLGYQNREPYCAAAVCWWIREAVKAAGIKPRFVLPTSAKAYDFEKWGKNNTGKGVTLIDRASTLEPGDIIVWEFSHVSLVESRLQRGQTNVQTIDANTSPSSSNNEGGGVYRRTRKRTLTRAVLRISA